MKEQTHNKKIHQLSHAAPYLWPHSAVSSLVWKEEYHMGDLLVIYVAYISVQWFRWMK